MKKILQGMGVSFGQASGKVRVVKDQKEQDPFYNL
jgi:phosphoenolpyruvate synthase/pyruvate phosphate dikinase